MPVRPLSQIAAKACVKNIRSIFDVGDAPYAVVRPVLLKVENPEQLRQIEEISPQICGLDGEVWLELIKRDVPNWHQKPHKPKNPKNWYKVYRKLVAESKRDEEEDTRILKAELDRIKDEQKKNTVHRVELNIVKVPEGMKSHGSTIRFGQKALLKEKTFQPPPGPDGKHHRAADSNTERGPRPGHVRAAPVAKSKLAGIRKEAKAMGRFQHQSKGKPGIWTAQEMKLKPNSMNQIAITAPPSLIEHHRKPAPSKPLDPSIKLPLPFAPPKRRIEHENTPQPKRPKTSITEERDIKLKTFIDPSTVTAPVATTNRPITPPSLAPCDQDIPLPPIGTSTASAVPKSQAATPMSSPLKRFSPNPKLSTPSYRIPRTKARYIESKLGRLPSIQYYEEES